MPAESIVHLGRDPFARADRVRARVPRTQRRPCEGCGMRLGRFRYGTWADGLRARPQLSRDGYCSIDCWRLDTRND